MKLSELRTEIANELQYNPTAASYVDSVTRVINAVYEEICAAQRWHFLEEVTEIDVEPEVSGTMTFNTLHSAAYDEAAFPGEFVGSTLVNADGDTYTVVSQEIDGVNSVAYFQPDFASATTGAQTTKLKYTAYLLPKDCDAIQGVIYRSEMLDVVEVSRAKEQRLALNLERTGMPQVFFEEDTKTVKGIDLPYQGAVSAAAGTFTNTGAYRWFYTLTQHGAESSPSNIVDGTITALTDVFTLTGMENTQHLWEPAAPAGNQDPGIYKTIYREYNNSGIFYPLAVPKIWDSVTNFVDTGFAVDVTKPFEYTSGRRRIRYYPLSDKVGKMELRYKFRPQRLVRDADTPVLPPEFHRLLVYRAVAILASQHDGDALAAVHEKLAHKMYQRMRRRYLGGDAAKFRQRRYWNDLYRRVIQPDITWNG